MNGKFFPGQTVWLRSTLRWTVNRGRTPSGASARSQSTSGERRQLALARGAALEVPDQADADAPAVVLLGPHVSAVQLTQPAGTELDRALGGIPAVADDEMVGESVRHPAPPVRGVVDRGVAVLNRAVVGDDVAPPAGLDPQLRGRARHGGDDARRGDGEALAGTDEVVAQAVPRLELRHRDLVARRDAAERLAVADDVAARPRRGPERDGPRPQSPGREGGAEEESATGEHRRQGIMPVNPSGRRLPFPRGCVCSGR